MARPSKIEIPGRVENGKLVLDPYQNQRRKLWLNDMKQSDVIEILKRRRKPKTPNQLGYIFAGIIDTVKRTLDERGEDVNGAPYTEEQIKKVLYFQHHVKNGGNWDNFSQYQSLSQHDDRHATSEFIDFSLQWLAGPPWYVAIPDARPREELKR